MRAGKPMETCNPSFRNTAIRLIAALLLAFFMLELLPEASRAATTITPTNEWVNFYSQASYLNGQPLPVGAQVVAYNPRGVAAGIFTVTHIGWYGLMPVYRDDPNTPEDEGLRPGEAVTFKINGVSARPDGPDDTVWTGNGALMRVNLIVSSVTPTNEWVNFYSQNSTLNSSPLPAGALVQAFDPQGVLCGESIVTHAGWYGLLSCYRDDPNTPADEGASPGDAINFKVNGYSAQMNGPDPATWNQNGGLRQVNVSVNAPTPTQTSTRTPTPTATGPTPTRTHTLTPTLTATGPTPTRTPTRTPTLTPTGTPTYRIYLPLVIR